MSEPRDGELTARRAALLGRAGRLAELGHTVEAIECLSSANRIEPDPDLERELLRLRVDAARRAVPPSAGAPWPRSLPDPFPSVEGLPETTPGHLDSAILGGAILHHGALLVRGIGDGGHLSRLKAATDAALAGRAAVYGAHPDRDGWYQPLLREAGHADLAFARALTNGFDAVLLADSPRAWFLVEELLTQVGIIDVIGGYLGETPVLSANKTTLRRMSGVPTTPAWHQDGSFMGEVRVVNLWLALSHCGGETGAVGLDVVPQRIETILDTGTEDAEGPVIAIGRKVVERSSRATMITPEFQAGDALLFDERFLHRTSAAPGGDGTRYALEAWFFAPSSLPPNYVGIAV